jgi:hypothetical protein
MKFKSDIEVQAGLRDGSNDIGTAGQLLSSTGTITNWIDQGDVVAAGATRVLIACKNTSGGTITKGTPVYQTGNVGATDVIEVAEADALISTGYLPAIGLLETDLINNAFGHVVITGELLNITTDPIDGLTPTTGDTIYLKSGGGLTLTKPTGEGNAIQNLGLVGKVSGGNAGSLTVASIMRQNDVPNLPTGKIWIGDGNTIVSDTVYVDEPNNRVGIGTTSPATTFHVSGGDIRIDDTEQLQFGAGGVRINNDTSGRMYLRAPLDFYFATNSGYRMVLKSAGNLGIGTTSPSSRLDVLTSSSGPVATLKNTSSIGGSGLDVYGGTGSSSNILTLYDKDSNQRLEVTGEGNVGIGTTSPSARLEVQGTSSNTQAALKVTDSGDSFFEVVPDNNTTFKIGDLDAVGDEAMIVGTFSDITFSKGGTTTMILDSNNRVGIGTTSPGYKLDVSGDAYIDETLNIETTISGSLTYGYSGVGAGNLVVGGLNFASFTPGVITLINQDTTISAGQDLGVLQFGGKDDQTNGFANGQIICTTAVGAGSGNTGGGIFRFLLSGNTTGSGPTEKMRITNTGNVGIGTTSPTAKLDVAGTIDTDNLTISGAQGTSGQVLTSTGSGVQWQSGGGGGATDLNGLSDVLIDGTSSYFVHIPSGLSGNPPDNVVIGSGTGYALTNGSRNTLVGHDAGDGITTGAYNTCIGLESGGNFNGNFNTTLGSRAGYLASGSKSNSVAIGYQSSAYLPSYTTAVGFRAGYTATAVYGAYLGYETMRSNTASFNVGIGYRAGYSNTGGSKNVYVGREAGKDNSTGGKRTCIGEIAGSTSTGSNVTLIGYNSQPSAAAASNEITLGDSNVATLRCAVTTITSLSDERDKSEIKDLNYGLDFIDSLQPREFVWDNRAEIKQQEVLDENGEPLLDEDDNIVTEDVEFYSANKGKKDFGFIAQEVKKLDNDTLRLVYSENEDKLEMSYGKLVPILVKAVQELKAEIEALKLQNK